MSEWRVKVAGKQSRGRLSINPGLHRKNGKILGQEVTRSLLIAQACLLHD